MEEETKKKISESHKGKHHSEETKRKISKTLEGHWIGEKNPKYKRTPRAKDILRELMKNLERLDKNGVIDALSVQSSGMNARTDYEFISFKIPKK